MIQNTNIFKRKIYSKLEQWKVERQGSTALLIKGARRVGKSTICREFARKEYKSYILIDFVKASKEIRELFEDINDLDYLLLRIQAIYKTSLYPRESVIIFDEVQFCPKARQAIKYLIEDGRYDYIETGSLLSIRRNEENILIPSEETRINMYPMDFEEFLWATGNELSSSLIRMAYNKGKPLGEVMHREMMKLFRLYILVGGMPQAINTYLETNDLRRTDDVKREIVELYIDVLQSIDRTGKASRIFQSIPGEMAKSKLRFQPGSVIKGISSSEMESVIKGMEDSLTVNFIYRTTDPNVGMGLHRDHESYRLALCDTGLFVTLGFMDKEVGDNYLYQKLLTDKLSADLGYVYENVVAQLLRSNGHNLYYYTFPADPERKNYYEVDFLISAVTKVNPIEVKSSGYKTHKSLDVFCQKYSSRVGTQIILYTKDLHRDGPILYLPVYMAGLL